MLPPKPPEPLVVIDVAQIFRQLGDYQVQRDIKYRRHLNLIQEQMEAIEQLLNILIANAEPLAQMDILQPINGLAMQMLDTATEAIRTHNDDTANLLGTIRLIGDQITATVENYERQRGR